VVVNLLLKRQKKVRTFSFQ